MRARLHILYIKLYALCVCTVHFRTITGFLNERPKRRVDGNSTRSFSFRFEKCRLPVCVLSSSLSSSSGPTTTDTSYNRFGYGISVLISSFRHIQSPSHFLLLFHTYKMRFTFKNPCANECSLFSLLNVFPCVGFLLLRRVVATLLCVLHELTMYGIMCCN